MGRLLLALLLSVPALACKFDAPGRCSSSADCNGAQLCIEGICSLCQTAADCNGWEGCSASRACEPLAGRCNGDMNCANWDQCDATHTCVLRPGHCVDSGSCAAWESCDANLHCALNPGRCNADSDCAAWASCNAGNSCAVDSSNGGDVLIWGTFTQGFCGLNSLTSAIAPVNSPTRYEVGFDCGSDAIFGRAFLSGAGKFVFEAGSRNNEIVTFTPDRLWWDTDASPPRWQYPIDPEANDVLAYDTSFCPSSQQYWNMQGTTGALMYGCPDGGGALDYYDVDHYPIPELTGVRVLSWNVNDYKLVNVGSSLYVVDPAGTRTAVVDLGTPAIVRSTPGGFYAATNTGATWERWTIAESGVATKNGTFNTTLADIVIWYPRVLDADGNLYAEGSDPAISGISNNVVVRMPLTPAIPIVVYRESDMPSNANSWSKGTLGFVLMHVSTLVTSP